MNRAIRWIISIFIAFIFIQSLYFKFSFAPEAVYIFVTVGTWLDIFWFIQYGAFLIGFFELIAAILLFTPFRFYGASMAAVIMSGAVFFHLFTPLGIKMPEFDNVAQKQVGNDGGLLFMLACGILVSSIVLLIMDSPKAQVKLKAMLTNMKLFQKSN